MTCKRCKERPLDIAGVARLVDLPEDTVRSHYRRGSGGLPEPDYDGAKPLWFPHTIRESSYGRTGSTTSR